MPVRSIRIIDIPSSNTIEFDTKVLVVDPQRTTTKLLELNDIISFIANSTPVTVLDNTIFIIANTSLQNSNLAVEIAQLASSTANDANSYAYSVYDKADNANTVANMANSYAYSVYGIAESANTVANVANNTATIAFITANTANVYAHSVVGIAQAASATALSANTTAINAINLATAAYDQTNNFDEIATTANATANFANSRSLEAKNIAINANTVANQANTLANSVYSIAQTANGYSTTAYNTAISAFNIATFANNSLSSKFNTSGGTITGNVAITNWLSVSNTVTINSPWSLSTGGGNIYLNSSVGNRIDFNAQGIGVPAVITNTTLGTGRSVGTRLVLNPASTISYSDSGIGIESGNIWFNSGGNTNTGGYKWYANSSNILTLTSAGVLNIISGIQLNSAATSGQYLRGNGTIFVSSTIQAADVPTLNQNTTGSAATLTNSRVIWGQNFNGSADVSGNLTSVGNITGTGSVSITATSGTLNLNATGSNVITANTNGSERLRVDQNGNIYAAAGATNMANGFFYIPSASGAPTGVPAAIPGRVPMYFDETNNKLYVYNSGWKSANVA